MNSTKAFTSKRFELIQEYFKCRYSNLYKVYDKASGRNQVIKIPGRNMPVEEESLFEEARKLLAHEYHLLRGIRHPGIPLITEYLQEGEERILVYEDFTGATLFSLGLAERIQGNDGAIGEILLQLIDTIKFLHNREKPIINGGIHPQSVLMKDDGQIMLIEFGFALEGDSPADRFNFRIHGANRYSSPEQLAGQPPTKYDDIYSIGAIAYLLATRKELDYSMDRKDCRACERITHHKPDFNRGLESIIMTMVSTDPVIRYNSPEEVEEDITRGKSRFAESLFEDKLKLSSRDKTADAISREEEKTQTSPKFSLRSIVEGLKMDISPRKKYIRAAPEEIDPASVYLQKYPLLDLKTVRIDRNLARLLPRHTARSIHGVVIEKNQFDEITLAVEDPSQVMIYDHISYISKGKLHPTLFRADPKLIDFAFEYIYNTPKGVEEMSWFEYLEKKRFSDIDLQIKRDKNQLDMFDKAVLEGPVVEAANRIVKEAISLGASDIHLEAFENETILRYRIDGVLHIMDTFIPDLARNIIKRFKILARMDIAQETVSQGGRVEVEIAGKGYDLRVSVIPVIFGESMVMRILDKGSFDYTLSDLGFDDSALEEYRKLLGKPHGMILVSGPTGSGKSTTLYASLKEINRPDRKLLTVEDPIEYQMPGINQVQVNTAPLEEEKRMTFSKALREFLRQDPDVILVGEIRDTETAHISVQAALTGHLLLSTIHTNDSVGIVTRLRDMGVAPYLVGSVLNGGIAQRLVRKICPVCRTRERITELERKVFLDLSMDAEYLYRGVGCDNCHDYGYKGRTGIYEIFSVTQEISDIISSGASVAEIRNAARKNGMNDILKDALAKAAKGIITMEEVNRVIAG